MLNGTSSAALVAEAEAALGNATASRAVLADAATRVQHRLAAVKTLTRAERRRPEIQRERDALVNVKRLLDIRLTAAPVEQRRPVMSDYSRLWDAIAAHRDTVLADPDGIYPEPVDEALWATLDIVTPPTNRQGDQP